MIDKIRITVQAGNGGKGCESYQRRTDRKKISEGGDGGEGGSVIFRAVADAPSISRFLFTPHITGESGAHGSSNHKRGKNGEDLVVLVPSGTTLYDCSRNLTIRERMALNEEVIVAQGGRGGSGNHGGKLADNGEKGALVELEITVVLKADVFLIGLPNSGKSSLLRQLTRSHAKTESYPFSTREPELGVWKYSDFEQLTLCDFPSLYRASRDGRGVGNDFLKHLELAKCVLYVLDPVSEFAASLKEGYEILRSEVEHYNPKFLQLPSAIVVNKIDAPGAIDKIKAEKWKPPVTCIRLSSVTGEGMDELKKFLEKFLETGA